MPLPATYYLPHPPPRTFAFPTPTHIYYTPYQLLLTFHIHLLPPPGPSHLPPACLPITTFFTPPTPLLPYALYSSCAGLLPAPPFAPYHYHPFPTPDDSSPMWTGLLGLYFVGPSHACHTCVYLALPHLYLPYLYFSLYVVTSYLALTFALCVPLPPPALVTYSPV